MVLLIRFSMNELKIDDIDSHQIVLVEVVYSQSSLTQKKKSNYGSVHFRVLS